MSATPCLADEAILAFVQGTLSIETVGELELHLSACSECRSIVAEAVSLFASHDAAHSRCFDALPEASEALDRDARDAPLLAGTRVSRYVICEVIGAGAAGIVYRALDSQLKRDVALKLLRGDQARADKSLRARLLREAQAMAQLAHPNVVNVFDVGTFDDEVFVVLELVQGTTLAAWLEQARSWHVIAAAFLEAGKGLAAAHAVKLVHRDFKPTNVLVSVDGRVRVTDFGLARPLQFSRAHESAALEHSLEMSSLSFENGTLTQTGALAGTPVYMAPEQFACEPADERSDQFAFCVALYWALYRCHPYLPPSPRAPSLPELMAALRRGELRLPAQSSVPAELFDVLRTGLAVSPRQRFASMQALLSRLAAVLHEAAAPRATQRARRAVVATSMGVGLMLVILSALVITSRSSSSADPPKPAALAFTPSADLRATTVLPASTIQASEDTALPSTSPSPVQKRSRGKRAPSRLGIAPQASAEHARFKPNVRNGRAQYNDALRDPF